MYQGIAHSDSTRQCYSTAQRRFLEFCNWSGCVGENGTALPASEWTLMLFATQLSTTLKAESIKVYLAGIRSLHIENGLPNPLDNCLRLERVLRGIKRTQQGGKRQRLPITLTFTVLERIYGTLNLNNYDDALFWAAYCIGFYGFLRSGEFTTKGKKFYSEIDLSLKDVQVDRRIDPWVLLVTIKCSKTDPFRKGHTIRLGVSKSEVCAVKAMHYLRLRGDGKGPLFCLRTGLPRAVESREPIYHSLGHSGGVQSQCWCTNLPLAWSQRLGAVPVLVHQFTTRLVAVAG